MSLATLLTPIDVNNEASISEFSFANQDQHRLIVMQSHVQKNITLTDYPLDPIVPYGLAQWFQLHQQAHNDMSNALNVSNFDISDVDFRDRDQLQAWLWLHFTMHQEAAQLLGLT
jgi:hypothetical protein